VSPLFYILAVVVMVCAVCLMVIEYRIRKIATEMRMARVEMERNKKNRLRDFQRKEIERLRREIAGTLR